MAYTKQTWVDRVVQYVRRFSAVEEAGSGYVLFTPQPGTVTEAGTPVDASRLNHMETGIEDAHAAILAMGNLDTDEVATGMTWIDGRTIYRKVVQMTLNNAGVDITASLGVTCELAWVDYGLSFIAYNTDSTTICSYCVSASDYAITYITSHATLHCKYWHTGTLYAVVNYVKAA